MGHRFLRNTILLACAALIGSPAVADKPAWAGGKHAGGDRMEEHGGKGHNEHRGGDARFDDDARRAIFDYYGQQARGGHCPPGLKKKHNGCLPPGQAKKWALGQPLPTDVRAYALPGTLLGRLPPPPPQHRYVQVAQDILLIAVGTGMVVDAVEDILR